MRDRLLAALRERLHELSTTGGPMLDPERDRLAEALWRTVEPGVVDLEVSMAVGWHQWHRHHASQDENDLRDAVHILGRCLFFVDAAEFPEDLLPDIADIAAGIGNGLLAQAASSGDLTLVEVVVDGWRRVLTATPPEHPQWPLRAVQLGTSLHFQYELTAATEPLEESITHFRAAVASLPGNDAIRSPLLSNFAIALRERAERSPSVANIGEALTVAREAAARPHADRHALPTVLSNLGMVLQLRVNHQSDLSVLPEAVAVSRAALREADADHPALYNLLTHLGTALVLSHKHGGPPEVLDEAVSVSRQALRLTRPDHPAHSTLAHNLIDALLARGDLEEVFSVATDTLSRTAPGRPLYDQTAARFVLALSRLRPGDAAARAGLQLLPVVKDERSRETIMVVVSDGLIEKAARTRAPGDIEAAESVLRQFAAGGSSHAKLVYQLALCLWLRFRADGSPEVLDEAIDLTRRAVDAAPDEDIQAVMRSQLGIMLVSRFDTRGTLADLDEAVQAHRDAVAGMSPDHPHYFERQWSLGQALQARFERLGSKSDLNASIDVARHTLSGTIQDAGVRASVLSSLGQMLRQRHSEEKTQADLDEAIAVSRQAVLAGASGQEQKATFLSNLGLALAERAQLAGSSADADEAVDALRQSVRLTAVDGLYYAAHLFNLAFVLHVRWRVSGTLADLSEAIATGRLGVEHSSPDQPLRGVWLGDLGVHLLDRHLATESPDDLDAAVRAFTEAARTEAASVSHRLRAAVNGGGALLDKDPGRAFELLALAVELLPKLPSRRLSRGEQQEALVSSAGLASTVAALALDQGHDAFRALQLLEQGRAVLHSQLIDTRTDLTDLRERHPEIAAQFESLRLLLDGATGEDRHRRAAEFEACLDRVHRLKGFERFLLLPDLDQLTGEAADGPVVVFNTHRTRCDALIVRPSGLTELRLHGLDQQTLVAKVGEFHSAARMSGFETLDQRRQAREQLNGVLEWLWDTCMEPVLRELGFNDTPQDDQPWPRAWWAPGGLLNLLPIHAAGHHAERKGRTVMDRVVSSYTPTIRALRYARQRRRTPDTLASLVVGMPITPQAPPLPFSEEEAQSVGSLLEGSLVSEDGSATTAWALRHLGRFPLVHLACHGVSDPADPAESRLLLSDHVNDPLTVARLIDQRLGDGQLAYLSACLTAFSLTPLMDESIHLAAAFQLAGFPHVVGTLWPIGDRISVEVARSFYSALMLEDGRLDLGRAAYALHRVTRELRDRFPNNCKLWGPYLHMGA
ncbi:CHAT domain-containing protein [Nonomuraea wenchangensis]|uniref:CHAT domain-containing protein n=2 Tax=Nonomuraea wenchangensis TaxID=568860 RepID=A0A1I0LJS0_9ACTN|nr:CHAT domain-containing protein [Nonomuraea wenchangensis]